MVSEDKYCRMGDKTCRHLSINIIVERIPIMDKYGFQEYKDGNLAFKTVVKTDEREYCNDAGDYIKNMARCPLQLPIDTPKISMKETRQTKLEDML